MACINKKFWESFSSPTLFTTLAAIGTADTPAAPIRGFILFLLRTFINLAIKIPDAVPIEKAIIPKDRMPSVSGVRN